MTHITLNSDPIQIPHRNHPHHFDVIFIFHTLTKYYFKTTLKAFVFIGNIFIFPIPFQKITPPIIKALK